MESFSRYPVRIVVSVRKGDSVLRSLHSNGGSPAACFAVHVAGDRQTLGCIRRLGQTVKTSRSDASVQFPMPATYFTPETFHRLQPFIITCQSVMPTVELKPRGGRIPSSSTPVLSLYSGVYSTLPSTSIAHAVRHKEITFSNRNLTGFQGTGWGPFPFLVTAIVTAAFYGCCCSPVTFKRF